MTSSWSEHSSSATHLLSKIGTGFLLTQKMFQLKYWQTCQNSVGLTWANSQPVCPPGAQWCFLTKCHVPLNQHKLQLQNNDCTGARTVHLCHSGTKISWKGKNIAVYINSWRKKCLTGLKMRELFIYEELLILRTLNFKLFI